MWANLLSGTIGSVIGVIGAFVAAYLTLDRTRRHQAELAYREHEVATSGLLAYRLVALYDALKALLADHDDDESATSIQSLRSLATSLRESIVIDAPLLPDRLQKELKQTRQEMSRVILDHPSDAATIFDLRGLLQTIRKSGDSLRQLRRDYAEAARQDRSGLSEGRARRRTPRRRR